MNIAIKYQAKLPSLVQVIGLFIQFTHIFRPLLEIPKSFIDRGAQYGLKKCWLQNGDGLELL